MALKQEESKRVVSDDEGEDMGFGLFDDGDAGGGGWISTRSADVEMEMAVPESKAKDEKLAAVSKLQGNHLRKRSVLSIISLLRRIF